MPRSGEQPGSAARRTLVIIGRYVWLPTLVLLAIDLTVPKEHSVIRGWGESHNFTITHDQALDVGSGDHVYFGLDGTDTNDVAANSSAVSLGSWSGDFEASVAGETDPGCWSPVSFRVDLSQADEQVTGTGKYRVDPASCSTFGEQHEVFVTAFGERRGGRVSLRLRDSDTGDLLMTFDGLIMPQRLSGWFYGPDARPASGPVTMKPSDG